MYVVWEYKHASHKEVSQKVERGYNVLMTGFELYVSEVVISSGCVKF